MLNGFPNARWSHKFRLFLVLLFWMSGSFLPAYGSPPGSHAGYYIAQYGQITPEHNAQIARAYAIFKRVAAVADKSKKRLPKLIVVNSNAEPWAIALPDGHIILSKQAVNICHTQIKQTDACLAFILGHELAHLANDDFWHQEVYSFLATHKQTQAIAHFLKNNSSSTQAELAADDKGFIYAAMAGFPVALLIDVDKQGSDFFERWMQLTNSRLINPEINKNRSAPLVQRLKELKQKLAFYEFGVRLSHFGRCDDSIYFFKEFQKIFPGREVFNNLGYCYLQLALQKMDANRARFYWLPTLLDIDTHAAISARGERPLKTLKAAAAGEASSELLDYAIEYLKQAVAADPYYLPAKINLAVAFLYLGKPLEARVYLQQLRALQSNNSNYAELEALALYEESDAELDRWAIAVKRLRSQIEKGATLNSIYYNLARLLEVRSKTEESAYLWQLLAKRHNELPMPIRMEVCTKQKTIKIDKCIKEKKLLKDDYSPWQLPLQMTSLQKITDDQIKRMSKWDKLEFDWYEGDLYGQIYSDPVSHSQVLVMGQFVQMQIVKDHVDAGIKSSCGQKIFKRELAEGVVLTCGQWAVLERNGKIQEAWWMGK